MDVSFYAFGAINSWGDQGYNAVSNTQRLKTYEKAPIPVSIADLLKMENGDEKFHIGSYSFNTIKVMGIVASTKTDQDHTCITYELKDPMHEGVRMAPRFTVIRYHGLESYPESETLREGTFVQAVGKLRSFNDRLSLISFHISEVLNADEVKLFQQEAKMASLYYSQDIPGRSADQIQKMGVPLFACGAPLKGVNNLSSTCEPVHTPPVRDTGRRLYQPTIQSSINQYYKPANDRGPVDQQTKIYEFVRRYGTGEKGISLKQICMGLKASEESVLNDISILINRSVLYSTIDEEHFASIDD